MNLPALASNNPLTTKPLLKWVGGKTQLLNDIIPKVPKKYGRYIEPFFGGGALFFALMPKEGIIADSNPEIINFYRCVAADVDGVIYHLRQYENTEELYYAVRASDWTKLPKIEAEARTIFLNRTCFNGLYRVNKSGRFNVPYGHYKNPKIIDEEALNSASLLLRDTLIVCNDYKYVLTDHAQPGDFIYLDPPYLPV